MDQLSPILLDNFIGQDHIVAQVRTALSAARKRMAQNHPWWEDLRTILAYGQPGLGKSAMGQVIACELGIAWFRLTGGQLTNAATARDWLRRIAAANQPYLLLLDEVDGAKVGALQELYLPMSESAFIDDDGRRVSLPPVIFYLTTNYLARIPQAIQSRAIHQFEFRPYPAEALATIAVLTAERLGYDLSEDAAFGLADNAQGEPRRVNTLLRLVIQDTVAHDCDSWITRDDAIRVINRFLYPLGLTAAQVELMRYLALQKRLTAGLQTLAHVLGQSTKDIQQEHERFLIREGLVVVVEGGRQLTDSGIDYVERIKESIR